jgi:hypothetical protein
MENLRRCEGISSVILVSDEATREAVPGADVYVDAVESETRHVIDGLRAAGGYERCLLMTGDLPLAHPEAIDDFLKCAPVSDIVYAIVEKSEIEEVYPGKEASYVGTRDGHFTGSSSLLLRPQAALSREELVISLLDARRNPAALLGLLGPGAALKLMLTKPALRDFEDQLSRALNISCRVFVSHYPELVISMDSPRDIRLMECELKAEVG